MGFGKVACEEPSLFRVGLVVVLSCVGAGLFLFSPVLGAGACLFGLALEWPCSWDGCMLVWS